MKLDNSSSVDFEQAPAKVHPARLVAIYDIGKQPANEALGYAAQNKTIWVYELLGKDRQEDGGSFKISEFVSVSLHVKGTMPQRLAVFGAPIKKKSKDWYEIDPGYILSSALGKPCMVEVAHTEAGKAKVNGVTQPIDGLTVQEYTEKLAYLDLDSDDYLDHYNSAPQWIKDLVDKKIG